MDIIIAGAGGHGKIVLDILRAAGQHNILGFLDADTGLHNTTVAGLPVLGHLNLLPKLKSQGLTGAIVAIGDNRTRRSYAQKLTAAGLTLINAIHPSAIISPSAKLGHNLVIAPGVIICAEASIADSVILNTACTIDHECSIAEAVHISPGAHLAGRVTVQQNAFIGIGVNILPCLTIGQSATIGGGALVRTDIPPHSTAVGVPARIIKRQDPATPI